MSEPHLSDDHLIDMCVAGALSAEARGHLAVCPVCHERRDSIDQILRELDEAATLEAEAAFPPERLGRQQSRILHRIDRDGRPGRLIAFPAAGPMLTFRSRPHVRWAAGAAAAAFVIGVLAGHLAHNLPLRQPVATAQIVANESNAMPLRAVSTTFSEDEFLGQVEAAAASRPAALRPLDAMTPRAWEAEAGR
jgi:hypothetical protein